ncbi:LPS assembly protein LptD [uncultured Limimaricola sp.]|uniref:LPS-assembly protein LptD n=1 Tax=uncultured Limimaricola sp. TaxID=2211667 RepID=UPI0030F76ECF
MIRLLSALLCLLPGVGAAQGLAQLVADSVTVTAQETLVARGHVEAFYDGTRLTASEIAYDRGLDRLTVTGPILITTPDGEVFTAEAAAIDPKLESGLLRGARLVLDRQLQIAASRIDRTDSGLTALTRTAATSCQVCGDNPPLWEIRADRVVHDEVEQQLYFDNATFRIRGVPVIWLPRMRLPDPTLERASGLLVPQLFSSDALGFGLKLPYFVRLGGRRDLTVTPWIATKARNLELGYRQAWRSGWVKLDTHLAEDDATEGLRYAILGEGAFSLPRDVRLEFDLEAVSDAAFLLDYDLSDADRLDSRLRAYRLQDGGYALGQITYYESLRDGESSTSLPPLVARLERETVLRPGPFGGQLTLRADADALWRDGPTPPEARDVVRAGISAGWRQDRLIGPGLILGTELQSRVDAYVVTDDPARDTLSPRAWEAAGVTLRWPLIRHEAGSDATQVIEPVASLSYATQQGTAPANEDSRLPEFGSTSLHTLDRLPGEDLQETGFSAGLGLRWSRTTTDGRTLSVLAGQLLRDDELEDLAEGAGLGQTRSDWLVSARADLGEDLGFNAYATFDNQLDVSSAEARLGLDRGGLDLSAAYLWLQAETGSTDLEAISEVSFDAALDLGPRWSLVAQARYDIAADAPVRAQIGAGWHNECVTVDLSASRRYTDTDDVDPSTSFGLSVNLNGFSAARQAVPAARDCEG